MSGRKKSSIRIDSLCSPSSRVLSRGSCYGYIWARRRRARRPDTPRRPCLTYTHTHMIPHTHTQTQAQQEDPPLTREGMGGALTPGAHMRGRAAVRYVHTPWGGRRIAGAPPRPRLRVVTTQRHTRLGGTRGHGAACGQGPHVSNRRAGRARMWTPTLWASRSATSPHAATRPWRDPRGANGPRTTPWQW